MAESDVIDQENAAETEADASSQTAGLGDDAKTLIEELKKSIAVTIDDIGVLRRKLTIRIPRDAIRGELDKQYKEIITDAVVPGFRRGRAPRRLVEKRYGQEVGEQVTSRLMSSGYLAAIEKHDLKVLGDPLVWSLVKDKKAGSEAVEKLVEMPTALEHATLPEEGDYEFKCEVEIKPEFELPDLEKIAVERPALTITDDDVETELKRLRARRGSWAIVETGGIEIDDLVVCDYRLKVGEEEVCSKENELIAARGQVLEGIPLEGLGDTLKGAKSGDDRTIEEPVPDEYERENLRGKTARFEIKVHEVKRMKLPEVDKEFLESQGFDSEQELRDAMREQMTSRLDQEVRRAMRTQVCNYLLEKTPVEVPEGLSMRQTARVALRRMVELRRRGVPPEEIEKHADELRTSASEVAVRDLKLHFVLERIAEKLEIEVTEEEINGQIAAMARAYNRRFDRVRDELAKDNGIEQLYLEIRDEKCIDKMLETAEIRDKPLDELKEEAKAAASSEKGKAQGASKPRKKGAGDSAELEDAT